MFRITGSNTTNDYIVYWCNTTWTSRTLPKRNNTIFEGLMEPCLMSNKLPR